MRHIGVRIYESPHGGRLLGWVSVRVGGKRGLWTPSLHRIVRREPSILFVKVAANALPPDWEMRRTASSVVMVFMVSSQVAWK